MILWKRTCCSIQSWQSKPNIQRFGHQVCNLYIVIKTILNNKYKKRPNFAQDVVVGAGSGTVGEFDSGRERWDRYFWMLYTSGCYKVVMLIIGMVMGIRKNMGIKPWWLQRWFQWWSWCSCPAARAAPASTRQTDLGSTSWPGSSRTGRFTRTRRGTSFFSISGWADFKMISYK